MISEIFALPVAAGGRGAAAAEMARNVRQVAQKRRKGDPARSTWETQRLGALVRSCSAGGQCRA